MAPVVMFALLCGVLVQAAPRGLLGSLGNSTMVPDAEGHAMSTNTTAVNGSSSLDGISAAALGALTSSSSKGKVMTLYHQTSPEIAALILKGGFKAGSGGWCGGGIYFATTIADTDQKAIGPHSHTGFIIVATVDVGKVLHLNKTCDRSMTGKKLARRGYNSIVFNPGDGDEHVVYSNDRVISAKAYSR
mmetsp:Transcript_100585/g.288822  ORF Transcript_100585/g.288822 Transcript_100585/m.288822 type:complete len:189 (-) Transcript_100585:182-748(-)